MNFCAHFECANDWNSHKQLWTFSSVLLVPSLWIVAVASKIVWIICLNARSICTNSHKRWKWFVVDERGYVPLQYVHCTPKWQRQIACSVQHFPFSTVVNFHFKQFTTISSNVRGMVCARAKQNGLLGVRIVNIFSLISVIFTSVTASHHSICTTHFSNGKFVLSTDWTCVIVYAFNSIQFVSEKNTFFSFELHVSRENCFYPKIIPFLMQ